jgi:hypothetical protein
MAIFNRKLFVYQRVTSRISATWEPAGNPLGLPGFARLRPQPLATQQRSPQFDCLLMTCLYLSGKGQALPSGKRLHSELENHHF